MFVLSSLLFAVTLVSSAAAQSCIDLSGWYGYSATSPVAQYGFRQEACASVVKSLCHANGRCEEIGRFYIDGSGRCEVFPNNFNNYNICVMEPYLYTFTPNQISAQFPPNESGLYKDPIHGFCHWARERWFFSDPGRNVLTVEPEVTCDDGYVGPLVIAESYRVP